MAQPALTTPQLFDLMARHGITGELATIMVAAALIESSGVPDLIGDNGHAVGLFQMHDLGLGSGLTFQQRADPDMATRLMQPHFASTLATGQAAGKTGADLATYTYMFTERPRGFPDLASEAATRYRAQFESLGSPTTGPTPTPAAVFAIGATVAVATRDGLRLRAQAGLNKPIRLVMVDGTLGRIEDGPRTADGFTWWKLRVDDTLGWAAEAFLRVRAGVAPTAGRSRPGPIVAVTSDDGLRLRGGPSLNTPVLLMMPEGTLGQVLDGPQPADGFTWWQLRVGDLVGWAAGEFFKTTVPPEPVALDASVLEPNGWIAIDPPIQSFPGSRLADDYDRVIDQFGVATNPRYQPRNGMTYCNIFVSDVTRAMHAAIPHRIDAATGDPDDNGQELTCGGMIAWLQHHGARFGWTPVVSAANAQAAANLGQPAVMITPAGVTHAEEHTSVIRPGALDPQLGPVTAQAGAQCLNRVNLGKIMGSRAVTFWVHV